jgi:hypothetical protein
MKHIQTTYFAEYYAIRQDHPDISGRDAWILTEMKYDYDMYISYGSFRVALSKFIKSKNTTVCLKK